jgi:hypothetical protein
MASRNPDLRHHGTGNRKRKQCKNALRYPGIKKNFQKQQLKTILKQLTTCLTHLHCSLLSGFDLLYTLVDFFLKVTLYATSIRFLPLLRLGPHGNVR